MTFLLQISLVLLYSIPVYCLGSLLINRRLAAARDKYQLPYPALLCTAFLLGQGILAVIWQFLGLLGWFSPKLIIGILVLSVVVSGRFGYELTRNAFSEFKSSFTEFWQESWAWRALAVLGLFMFAALAMTSFAGPVVVGSDASAFYMVFPKMMAAAHRIVPTTDYVIKHSTFGFIGEMHFAALMSLGAGTTAKSFSLLTGMTTAMMLVSIGSLAGLNRRTNLIILIILLNSTTFTSYMCDGKVDMFGTAFGVSAVFWALQTSRLPGKYALMITGLLLGWAVYGKLSFLVSLSPVVAIILIWRAYIDSPDQGLSKPFVMGQIKNFLILGVIGFLVLLPLAIKNFVLFGEPLAPVYYFSRSWWGTWFVARGYADSDVLKLLLTYPLALVLGAYDCQAGRISPLVLIFAPFALLLPRGGALRKNTLFQVTIATLVGLTIWVIIFPKGIGPRFILPTLLLFALFAAHSAEHILTKENKPRLLSAGIWLCLFFLPILFMHEGVKYYRGPVHFWQKLKFSSYEGRMPIEGRHPVVAALELVNQKSRPGDRVFMGMIYRYWLRSDMLQTLFDLKEWRDFHSLPWSVARWAYLYDRGVRFFIVDSLTHKYLLKMMNIKKDGTISFKPDWLKIKRIFHQGRWSVFSLESTDPKRRPKVRARQISPPYWEVVPNSSKTEKN